MPGRPGSAASSSSPRSASTTRCRGHHAVWTAYVEAKRDADVALRDSGLDWTILRPGALTDDEPLGTVQLAERVTRGSVPRADVAAVLAGMLDSDAAIGQQWELVSGDTPVDDAVALAVTG